MNTDEILGDYQIIGTNQNDSKETYRGILTLTLSENGHINAKWLINKSQIQTGIGFFKNNILVINFEYQGDENDTYKGLVIYKCITKEILEGFWYEEFGDPKYLGSENCFKIKNKSSLLN